ncbi:MAG: hypothetical protein ACXWUG_12635 [Polyangiales bacterium]
MIVRSLAFALLLALSACTPKAKGPQGPTRPLSSWVGEEAQLFADTMDAGALPPNVPGTDRDEENEAKIPRRLDLADGVIGAKIIGVNAETRAEKTQFRVELAVEGQPLSGKSLDSPFNLIVLPDTAPYAAFKSGGANLIGRKVIVFFKRYAPVEEGEDPVTHFHISPMTPAVQKAIEVAKTRKQFD